MTMERWKSDSLRSLFLVLMFYGFFEASKHVSSIAKVNPFADDPYDGIGSIAVQLALFLGLLSVLRSFRPYQAGAPSLEQRRLITKGHILSAAAICLTMLGDLVAMVRHAMTWELTSEGRGLAMAVTGLLVLSAEECWRSWRTTKDLDITPNRGMWLMGFASVVGVLGLLAIYPERVRYSLGGALVTALAGGFMLLLPLGVIARTTLMNYRSLTTDVVDDVIAMCEGIKARTSLLFPIYAQLDRLQRARWPQNFAQWINPRRYRWRLSLFAGSAFGLALVTAELWSDGFTHLSSAALVIAVFVMLQSTAVLTGRALLADPLGLFREDGSVPGTVRRSNF
jgi:hypothetical protein